MLNDFKEFSGNFQEKIGEFPIEIRAFSSINLGNLQRKFFTLDFLRSRKSQRRQKMETFRLHRVVVRVLTGWVQGFFKLG